MKKNIQKIKQIAIKYPAGVAACFIIGYFFISNINFYQEFKVKNFTTIGILSNFDTVLWMWALSYLLLMIVKLREKFRQEEKKIREQQYAEELKDARNKTVQEVILTLRHEINNPLAIIYGYSRLLKKHQLGQEELKEVKNIEIAAQRINATLKQLSESQFYEVINSPVGDLIDIPPHKIN